MALCLCVFWVGTGRAEEKQVKDPPPAETPAKKARQDTKAILMEATRVSTDKAAESASRQKPGKDQKEASPKPSDDEAVTEFRPLPPGEPAAHSETAKQESTGGALKNVHGTVYGNTGSQGGTSGASVGTTTRNGKTSVYVEGQRNRTRDPRR